MPNSYSQIAKAEREHMIDVGVTSLKKSIHEIGKLVTTSEDPREKAKIRVAVECMLRDVVDSRREYGAKGWDIG